VDIKDVILLVGGIFFVAVVVHGLWIAWLSKRNEITMDIVPSSETDEALDGELSKSEFPTGGARIAVANEAVEPTVEAYSTPAQEKLPLDELPLQQCHTSKLSPTINVGAFEQRGNSNEPATNSVEDPRGAPSSADELIIIGVLAKTGSVFNGSDLVEALRGQGLKFGNMSIFHRVDTVTQQQLFSVANALEPGTFDLADMQALETSGITFFLQLPVPGDAFEALEDMLLSARTVAAALGGEMKDDQMNNLTGQTVEHMRQRLADFARKQLTKRPL
jgi:cell division protein ZipA